MSKWNYITGGIPDEEFIRGKVPMTKEEVRAVILSKLRLKSHFNVLDIGAGTGSVSIEVALKCVKVKAIERNHEGVLLIERNAEKFGLKNIKIIEGKALENIDDIEDYDRIFIGGSGGELKEILLRARESMKKDALIVVTSITVETLYNATKNMEELGMDVEVTSIGVSKNRKVGNYNLMESLNSIYIIVGKLK